jgi:hypothetical protein
LIRPIRASLKVGFRGAKLAQRPASIVEALDVELRGCEHLVECPGYLFA